MTPDENASADAHAAVLGQWRQELSQLREANKKTLLGMAATGIRPEQTSLLHARFDCLIDAIAEAMGPSGEDFTLLAHMRWQQSLREKLAEVAKEGTRAVLGQGSLLSPGEISELAKVTGTPGWRRR